MNEFKDTEGKSHTGKPYMTAAEKQLVFAQWQKFINNGCKIQQFTDRLYKHLTLHCSFIAHYNRHGFYETYFTNTDSLQRFFRQFDNDAGNISVEFGMNAWYHDSDYHDINKAMCDFYTQQKDAVLTLSGRVIQLGVFGIRIDISGKGGKIYSELNGEPGRHGAAIDGMESLILAMACAGIDVDTPAMKEAIETTVDAISNNY